MSQQTIETDYVDDDEKDMEDSAASPWEFGLLFVDELDQVCTAARTVCDERNFPDCDELAECIKRVELAARGFRLAAFKVSARATASGATPTSAASMGTSGPAAKRTRTGILPPTPGKYAGLADQEEH